MQIQDVKDANGIIFAAAGNTNDNSCIPDDEDRYVYPCASDHTICVGNYQWDGDVNRVERFFVDDDAASNFGDCVNIWAPGDSITMALAASIDPSTDIYYDDSGTSFASPTVAGIAAVWLAQDIRDGELLDIVGNTDNLLTLLQDDGYTWETCDFQSVCYGVKYPDCPTLQPTLMPSKEPTGEPTNFPTISPTDEERDLIDELIENGWTGWALLIIIIILACFGISVYRNRNKNKKEKADQTAEKVKLEMTHA